LFRTEYARAKTPTPSWQVLEAFAANAGECRTVLDDEGRVARVDN
jgi:hypothetical protein